MDAATRTALCHRAAYVAVPLTPDADLATLNLWLATDMPEDHEDCDDLDVAWDDVRARVTGDGDYPLMVEREGTLVPDTVPFETIQRFAKLHGAALRIARAVLPYDVEIEDGAPYPKYDVEPTDALALRVPETAVLTLADLTVLGAAFRSADVSIKLTGDAPGTTWYEITIEHATIPV